MPSGMRLEVARHNLQRLKAAEVTGSNNMRTFCYEIQRETRRTMLAWPRSPGRIVTSAHANKDIGAPRWEHSKNWTSSAENLRPVGIARAPISLPVNEQAPSHRRDDQLRSSIGVKTCCYGTWPSRGLRPTPISL